MSRGKISVDIYDSIVYKLSKTSFVCLVLFLYLYSNPLPLGGVDGGDLCKEVECCVDYWNDPRE
jgi:hypothetical protein